MNIEFKFLAHMNWAHYNELFFSTIVNLSVMISSCTPVLFGFILIFSTFLEPLDKFQANMIQLFSIVGQWWIQELQKRGAGRGGPYAVEFLESADCFDAPS